MFKEKRPTNNVQTLQTHPSSPHPSPIESAWQVRGGITIYETSSSPIHHDYPAKSHHGENILVDFRKVKVVRKYHGMGCQVLS